MTSMVFLALFPSWAEYDASTIFELSGRKTTKEAWVCHILGNSSLAKSGA